jgi:hypothetical protein
MMKNLMVAALLGGLTAMTLSQAAVAADHGGQLPLYPHGAPAHGVGDIFSNALTQGVPVDQWYKATLPSRAVGFPAPAPYNTNVRAARS